MQLIDLLGALNVTLFEAGFVHRLLALHVLEVALVLDLHVSTSIAFSFEFGCSGGSGSVNNGYISFSKINYKTK